jgi:hypothetical protein
MAVDFWLGEMALDLAQFRAIQGAVRGESEEIKKRERERFKNQKSKIFFWCAQSEKAWHYCPRSCSPPSWSSDYREATPRSN